MKENSIITNRQGLEHTLSKMATSMKVNLLMEYLKEKELISMPMEEDMKDIGKMTNGTD